jgi:hypothetical protein
LNLPKDKPLAAEIEPSFFEMTVAMALIISDTMNTDSDY